MMRQRKSIGRKNKTIDEFKKHLPLIIKGNHPGFDDSPHIQALMRTEPMALKRSISRPMDRSISIRTPKREDKKESRSFNESKTDSLGRPAAKLMLHTPMNNLIMKNNIDAFKKISIKKNFSSITTHDSHHFDTGLGIKTGMPEELLTRTELYSKIRSKPQSTKGASKEITRLERTLQFVSNEGKLRKKTKLMDSIEMKPLVSPVYADSIMNYKKFKPDKTKTKSFQIDPQERMPSYERNIEAEERVAQPRVPYSLIPALEPARHSSTSFKFVKSYAVNTFKGLIREYNEDRVSIILNILQPPTKKVAKWPNCSFFGVCPR